MLKRLQHLGSRRLGVRGVFTAACGALLGGLCFARWLLACSDAVGKIMGPRDAPMARKELSSHTVFPNRVPLGRARTQLPLVGYSAPSFPRIIDSSEMNQTNKLASPNQPAVLSRQSNLKHSSFARPAPHSLRIPSTAVSGDRRCISLLRLIRKHVRLRRNKHAVATTVGGSAMADWPRNASLAGHKHVRKKNEQAEVRNEASDSQTIAMEITLIFDCRTSLNKSNLSTFRRHSTGVQRPTTTFPKSNTVFCQ